jgi:hypothetical protein
MIAPGSMVCNRHIVDYKASWNQRNLASTPMFATFTHDNAVIVGTFYYGIVLGHVPQNDTNDWMFVMDAKSSKMGWVCVVQLVEMT